MKTNPARTTTCRGAAYFNTVAELVSFAQLNTPVSVQDELARLFPAYALADTSRVWSQIETDYPIGSTITGSVVARFPFGLAIDFGAPLPGLLLVTRIPSLEPGGLETQPAYQVDACLTARILLYARQQNGIGLTMLPPGSGGEPLHST